MARRPTDLGAVRAARAAGKPIAPVVADETGSDQAHLPPACPVRPLGKDDGVRYYLDADRQLKALADKDHSRLGILGLFGTQTPFLYQHWPRHSKSGEITGWRPELAAEALMAACSHAGVWDPAERKRGRGAWRGDDGELVLHTGDRVLSFPAASNPWRDHVSHAPGVIGRYVYSAAAQVGAPAADAAMAGPDGPASELLSMISTWRFRRPSIDPVLLLGWIGAARIGGALRWRPMAWLTGGKGTGKSTLQELLKLLFAGGIIQTADSSPAGLWQTLRHQTLPVAFDELEAEEDNRRAIAVVKLARVAASGALMLRGGADHHSTEFVVRSSFLFSSILMPPLTPQDRSRISVLDLDELPAGAKPPELDAKALALLGAELTRRLVDGWPRLDATIEGYRGLLQAAGMSSRAADQAGTLLGCADLLLYDQFDAELAGQWVGQIAASDHTDSDDDTRDEERCLAHLLSSTADARANGALRSLAEWARIAAGADDGDAHEANRILGNYGLRVTQHRPRVLAVANYHTGLAKIFAGSHWAGRSGTMGVWAQSLRRLPGAQHQRGGAPIYFAGVVSRATLLPLDLVVPLPDMPHPTLPLSAEDQAAE